MTIECETQDVGMRRRKIGLFTPQSSSTNLINDENNNCELADSACDSNDDEHTYDADNTTLNPTLTKELEQTTDQLNHSDALQKLKEVGSKTPILASEIGTDFAFKRKVVWQNALGFLILHSLALVGVGLVAFGYTRGYTVLYTFALMYGSGLGVTMGAHRLWSHRAFKAKVPLKLFLLWLHTLAGQNCLYVWVRDHRQHHKYSDTDADPHNANRGFFFSHVGWLMSRKHPKVIEYGKKIDMSDLEADNYIMFQKEHYKVLYTIFALLLPTAIPIYFWNEEPIVALFVAFFARAIISLNATWLVNSAAHLYGTRPFDKTIFPVENMVVAFFAVGEGWHNYHHAFPWDYRASELGSPLNITGFLIDILAGWGWIYDRKEASYNMIKNRSMRTGDESHKEHGTNEGRRAFTTLFNIWKHPSNPTYNSIFSPKPKIINAEGYALIPDELSKHELDEELLSKENEILEERQRKRSSIDTTANADNMRKYVIDKAEATKLLNEADNVNAINNNDTAFKAAVTTSPLERAGKSKLNLDVDDALFAKI